MGGGTVGEDWDPPQQVLSTARQRVTRSPPSSMGGDTHLPGGGTHVSHHQQAGRAPEDDAGGTCGGISPPNIRHPAAAAVPLGSTRRGGGH